MEFFLTRFTSFVVVRSLTADSNLLQPTVSVNRTPSHVTFSRTHDRVAHDIGSRLSASRHPCFTRNVSSDLSSTLHFASHSPHLHLHGSGRSTLCASPNEELGILADNNPLTGQAADAVSAYTQVEMEDASKY